MKEICLILLAITMSTLVFSAYKKKKSEKSIILNPIIKPTQPMPIIETAIAFPGAEGFARNITGGRGGKVIFVSTITDGTQEGTLRYALNQTGARIIIFTVSGTIALKSNLNIKNGNVTIAGQTAPGDGICVKNYPVTVDADNVIIRYMRFRMGDERKVEADALGSRFHKDIIIDHCSMSWDVDEAVSFYANENTTVQWSVISESLKSSVHNKGPHGYGGIWGGKNASFHHNLLAHHDSRNPRFGEEAGKASALTDLVDFRNNVIYNWASNSSYGGEAMNINIVNNYYKPGPATPAGSKGGRIYSPDKNKTPADAVYDIWGKFYINGNYVDGYPNVTADNWGLGVYNQFHSSYGTVSQAGKNAMKRSEEHPINNNVTTHTAMVAYQKVLDFGGASLKRDAIDARIAENVKNKNFSFTGSNGSTKGIIDSQSDVGGWPTLNSLPAPADTDKDGMPDEWEIANKLNPNLANANERNLSTGYDNIEVYINSLVKTITEAQIK